MNNFYTTPTKKSNEEREITLKNVPAKTMAIQDGDGGRFRTNFKANFDDSLETDPTNRTK